jgi:hypothetical protein
MSRIILVPLVIQVLNLIKSYMDVKMDFVAFYQINCAQNHVVEIPKISSKIKVNYLNVGKTIETQHLEHLLYLLTKITICNKFMGVKP